MSRFVLALDQGTTSSRAILFDAAGAIAAACQHEFTQHFPQPGWVEHDANEIWDSQLRAARGVLEQAGATAADVAAIGITNQRETAVVWDRATGEPIHPAIVWQSRQTVPICDDLRARGLEPEIRARTGLVLDAYFSATKIRFILDAVDGAQERAARGELCFGTVDSWLVYKLTKGLVHATKYSNASRTMIYDIHGLCWDELLTRELDIPAAMLPEVRDSSGDFGTADPEWLGGAIPIAGIAGDQQAALFGHGCTSPGGIKNTYGTGCFLLMNTGADAVRSKHGLLTTIGWGIDGKITYCLEGSVFVAGAAVQWLRDGIGLIQSASETEALASSLADNRGVYLVPAFTGLGAPYRDPHARGAIFGLTRASGPAELARAALGAVCYQTRDLLEAMTADGAGKLDTLRVDGGMVANDWLLQTLADTLDVAVERPVVTETTALGAACLAGLGNGFFGGLEGFARTWQSAGRFEPRQDPETRAARYAGWQDAVRRVRSR